MDAAPFAFSNLTRAPVMLGTNLAPASTVTPDWPTKYPAASLLANATNADGSEVFAMITYDAVMGTKLDSWRYGPGFDVTDLTLVNGTLVITGRGSDSGDPSGPGLTARFPT